MHKIPEEQLTSEQKETLEKLEKSGKRIDAEIIEVLKRHGLQHITTLKVECGGFPPKGGCYCKDPDSGWYCCVG